MTESTELLQARAEAAEADVRTLQATLQTTRAQRDEWERLFNDIVRENMRLKKRLTKAVHYRQQMRNMQAGIWRRQLAINTLTHRVRALGDLADLRQRVIDELSPPVKNEYPLPCDIGNVMQEGEEAPTDGVRQKQDAIVEVIKHG